MNRAELEDDQMFTTPNSLFICAYLIYLGLPTLHVLVSFPLCLLLDHTAALHLTSPAFGAKTAGNFNTVTGFQQARDTARLCESSHAEIKK